MSIVVEHKQAKDKLTRSQRLRAELLNQRQTDRISINRARIVTASHKETEGENVFIRRAKYCARVLRELPIYIGDEDLLAGNWSSDPGVREVYPEFAVDWIIDEIDRTFRDRKVSRAEVDRVGLDQRISPADLAELREICTYWKDRCFEKQARIALGEQDWNWLQDMDAPDTFVVHEASQITIERLYVALDFGKALNQGFLGIMAEVKAELEATSVKDMASLQKVHFLRALLIVLEAGIDYARRHAALARHLAGKAKGTRQQELLRIAEVCEWVPANPPRDFYEAVQSFWFTYLLAYIEGFPLGIVPGRFDQYMYPFYKRAKEAGRITEEEAIELLGCLRIKSTAGRRLTIGSIRVVTSGELIYHTATLSGQTPDGHDATNDLSYLMLEAALRVRLPHPTLAIRFHDKMPEDFALKALEVVRVGMGFPAWFNDASSIECLLSEGVSLAEARDYAIGGCVNIMPEKVSGTHGGPWINMPKCLELALNNGVNPANGKQIGPQTGHFKDFSYADLVEAFQKQVTYFVKTSGRIASVAHVLRGEVMSALLPSGLVGDCIKRGKPIHAGGPRYEMFAILSVGMVDAVNSIAAMKKCVFEDKIVSRQDLLKALTTNFQGKEDLRRQLLAAPKFGNDDDYVDHIARDLYEFWRERVAETDSFFGGKYRPCPFSVSMHFAMGRAVGALPSGRLAGKPLADGSMSPAQGTDTCGPTAVVNSAGKVDQRLMQASLLNIKFHPSTLKTREDLKKLLALIKTYFDYMGKQIQFNVVDRKTLLAAQAHPEDHRNLIVRVAGYSALFTELHKEVQDEIISRTEHDQL